MKTFVALAALAAMSVTAQAGLFGQHRGCGASKCCDCAPTFQPESCRPKICRPTHRNVYNYQRTKAKPFGCCDNACDITGCAPAAQACAPLAGPAADIAAVCAPACAPAYGPAACCAPVDNGCAAPCADACDAGCFSSGHKCGLFGGGLFSGRLFGKHHGDACDDACCPTVDPCLVAELIYQSQTGCKAKHRRRALHRLGKLSCVCNPEIMSAFVYALNDADHRVRAKAAAEIAQQTRKNPCCCNQVVVDALTCALADCTRHVRRNAERALRQCGYDVVDCDIGCDGYCDAGCAPGCAPVGVPTGIPAGAPAAPIQDGEPAPAPPVEEGDRAYFPKRLPQQTAQPRPIRDSLSNLFSLAK